ncbi:MAG: HAMP domain-containing sensor histidine kinase [Candidatus Sericytochromatia bacterium]|nr:HAMP domain-containing sensor histidine kinase [Candidatus Sericytochromatia bacterium]
MYVDVTLAAQCVNLFGFLIPLTFSAFIARIYQEEFFAAWTKGYALYMVFFIQMFALRLCPPAVTFFMSFLAIGSYHAGASFLMHSARLLVARRLRLMFHPALLYGLPAVGAFCFWRTEQLGYALIPSAVYAVIAHVALGWSLSRFPAAFYRTSNRSFGTLVAVSGGWLAAMPLLVLTRLAWAAYLISALLHVCIGIWMLVFLLRRAQWELERSNAELRQLDALKTEFLHRVSHELRTPLTSIVTGHYLLRAYYRHELSNQAQVILSDVEGSTTRLNRLVGDLLNFSKLESESFHLHFQNVASDELVTEAASEFHTLCQAKNVVLEVISEGKNSVWGDREALRHLLSNLLMNALKFTPSGGKITLRVIRVEQYLCLQVSDTGIGIPKEESERIFRRFVQAKQSGAKPSEGVGLGLAICSNIVERHHGRIWVESQPGEGSDFFVELPLGPVTSTV